MISIDTNVLVRILIDDGSHAQVKAARNLAEKEKNLYISRTVQVETTWVLTRAYGLSKKEILTVLEELEENAAFILQGESSFSDAVHYFACSKADFSDCLIKAESARCRHIYTFDKKFADMLDVKLLK